VFPADVRVNRIHKAFVRNAIRRVFFHGKRDIPKAIPHLKNLRLELLKEAKTILF